jgi:Ca2+-binding RTX toxin-like protein
MRPPRPALRRISTLIAAAGLIVASHAAIAQAKISSSFDGAILTIHSGKQSDHVTVGCSDDGLVRLNGKDPAFGQLACSVVGEVDTRMGAGNDRVNLAGVGKSFGARDFPGFGHGTGAAAQLGPGNDRYVGSGAAFNLVLGGPGNDHASGGGLRDQLSGGPGNDILVGLAGNDVMLGQSGNDRVLGGDGDDLLSGNAGNDFLSGAGGQDLIGGGAGMDRLLGGPGDDNLVGGPGKDRLNGGPGNNTVVQDSPTKK